MSLSIFVVREGHPLKQGLKQDALEETEETIEVREGHPLKQGLKLQQQHKQILQ